MLLIVWSVLCHAFIRVGVDVVHTRVQVGTLLPSAFIDIEDEPDSPFYSVGPGIIIALGTMFALGFMATRAEPALNVVGQTVEKLSRGSFTCNMLVYSGQSPYSFSIHSDLAELPDSARIPFPDSSSVECHVCLKLKMRVTLIDVKRF